MKSIAKLNCLLISLLFSVPELSAGLVEMTLVPSPRASLTAAHDWIRVLSRVRDVRVRAINAGSAKPEIRRGDQAVIVTCLIGPNDELIVPGRKFSLRERSALRDWLEQQREGDPAGHESRRDRFGLTTEQLLQVHQSLMAVVDAETAGKNCRSVVSTIFKRLDLPLQIAPTVRNQLGRANVQWELRGLSHGTALAAVLYPLDLVLTPRIGRGGQVTLSITHAASVEEAWPIGWKPEIPVREALPKFFDFLEIEVQDTPLSDLLSALEGRLGVHLFCDQPLLELKGIDPTQVRVSIPAKRTFYKKVLTQALFQARLEHEVRVDERGQPFLWISPLLAKSR